jgi:ribosomal protein S12 methylthiotransferase
MYCRRQKTYLNLGLKKFLVVSQDTSAYGVDIQYRTGFWQGRPIKTRLLELAEELKKLARQYDSWVRLHYVYPYPSVDDIVPLMSDFLSMAMDYYRI